MTLVRIHIDSLEADLRVSEEEAVVRFGEPEEVRIRRILDRALRKVEAAYGLPPSPKPALTTNAPPEGRPAGWYRTMETAFAAEHYGFPAPTAVGEEHAAPDGSVWTFALTGTAWWEISTYAPEDQP